MAEKDGNSLSSVLGTIWGIYCGILGISIPLVGIAGEEALFIPAIAGFGAGVSSLVALLRRPKGAIGKEEVDMLSDTIFTLKEQVAEMENDLDDLRLQQRITQQTLLLNQEKIQEKAKAE